MVRMSCRRLPDSSVELNAKVVALINQSQTTPTLEIELKSKKVECEKLKNEVNDLKKELIRTKRDLQYLQSNKHATKQLKPMITVPAARPKATTRDGVKYTSSNTNTNTMS